MSSLPPQTTITAYESASTLPPSNLSSLSKLRWPVTHPPSDPAISFAGKSILVTGATAGLGFAAALKYAEKGASRLILTARSIEKGELARQEILARCGRDGEIEIVVLAVDLSSFSSVESFATTLSAEVEESGLHIALLNAGLANPAFEESEAGYEMGVQVNVLSTALMAMRILPLLSKTAEQSGQDTHLSFVNSVGHAEVQREWYVEEKSLLLYANKKEAWDARRSYGVLKLLGMSVMRHFAKVEQLLPSSLPPSVSTTSTSTSTKPQVIINACCPNLCRTSLGRNFSLPMRLIMGAMQYFTARSAEEGARTLVSATALGRESHGKFWTHDVLHPFGEVAMDEREMEGFWEEIRKELEGRGLLKLDGEGARWV